MPPPPPPSPPDGRLEYPWPLWAGFLTCTALFAFLSIMKFRAFNMGLDLGNMLQAFHTSLHGHLLEMTRTDTGENVNRLFGHVEGIYLLLLPIFALVPRPETLLTLQALALAAGGWAVFWNARQAGLDRPPATALAYAYWCFPYLANVAMADFHADAFMVFPYLMAWYSLKQGWPLRFWLFILLASSCKEYTSLFNFLLAVAVFREHRKAAMGLVALALGQFLIITPLLSWWVLQGRFQLQVQEHAIPGSAWGIVRVFTEKAFTREYAVNTLSLLLLLNVTWFRYPKGLILIVPIYIGLTIANPWALFDSHRHAMLIAPFFIVLVEGTARLAPRLRRRQALWGALVPAAAMMILVPGALFARNISETTYKTVHRNVFHYLYTRHDHFADSLLTLIPAQAPLASDLELRTKLADRRFAFVHPFPADPSKADYYLFDFFEILEFGNQKDRRRRCAFLMQSGRYFPVAHVDGLLVLRRGLGDSCPPFFLRRVDEEGIPGEDFRVDRSEIKPWAGGYILHTIFTVGRKPLGAQALISFFISPGADTLRVLHLPSFTGVDLISLTPGEYEEVFFFQTPAGSTLQGRRHALALYRKDPFLPFFARPEFLVKRL